MAKDRCVICGRETEQSTDQPIQTRERYISGSGQLCRACYYNLYLTADSKTKTAQEESQTQKLLDMSRGSSGVSK